MKKYILITAGVLLYGGYYYIERGNTTEYVYAKPVAYVDGATPTETEHWEMY
jgi:hypothetical protein